MSRPLCEVPRVHRDSHFIYCRRKTDDVDVDGDILLFIVIVPRVATNLGPVADLIVVRARRECGGNDNTYYIMWSRQRIS